MKTLKTIEKRVTEILTEYPEARNDDMRLYLLVSQSCIYETHGIGTVTFEDVMTNYKGYGIPCFESIRRTRQKIQAKRRSLAVLQKSVGQGTEWSVCILNMQKIINDKEAV